MNKDKISDELLDNLDHEFDRKPYFSWLEGTILLGHTALICMALYNGYIAEFALVNYLEELVITSISSSSIFYLYLSRQCTSEKKIRLYVLRLKIFRIASFLGALFLLIISIFAMFHIDLDIQNFTSTDWVDLSALVLFLISGLAQFYYTIMIQRNIISSVSKYHPK